MKHKIKIDATRNWSRPGWRWYVECACEQPVIRTKDPDTNFFGRSTWDAAFALGLAHLRQECRHV